MPGAELRQRHTGILLDFVAHTLEHAPYIHLSPSSSILFCRLITSIFLQLYLKPAVHISFPRSPFGALGYFNWSPTSSVCWSCWYNQCDVDEDNLLFHFTNAVEHISVKTTSAPGTTDSNCIRQSCFQHGCTEHGTNCWRCSCCELSARFHRRLKTHLVTVVLGDK